MKQNSTDMCVVYDPTKKPDEKKIFAIREQDDTLVVDEISSQLEELYKIRNPILIRTGVDEKKMHAFIFSHFIRAEGEHLFGAWAWYPWIKTLIHVLPETMHTELRTSRNRNLITKAEQQKYYNAQIGVAGLSVGNAVVSNILHTGGAKCFRIADADILSGSNTNRIRAGFDVVGLSKINIASREIYLTNPYAKIIAFHQGLTVDNLENFLLKPDPLDVVVDEMDNLYLKIQLRIHARRNSIPVVMAADNGDGVVVDIERYDLNKTLPLMHGDIPESELLAIRPDTPRIVAARIISTWVKPDNIAERMMLSVMELGKTLYTWPQLGNAATMAGSLMSYVVRKIVLGQPISQGKFVLSPDAIFTPEYTKVSSVARREKLIQQYKDSVGIA